MVRIIIALFVLVWITLLARIYQLSIHSNLYYETLAKQNIVKKEWILPVRGEIVDINGKPLAINKIGFKILIDPHLRDHAQRKPLSQAIASILQAFPKLDRQELIRRYRRNDSPYRHDPVTVVKFLPYRSVLPFYTSLIRHAHIHIKPATKRYYPFGKATAHIVGYVGRANEKEMERDKMVRLIKVVGKSGLERYYNRYLQGEVGYRLVKVSAFNQRIALLKEVMPKENRTVRLHLDMRLQSYIQALFQEHNQTGAAIVMRVDGAILSAGSFPSYDPNAFVSGISTKAWKKLIKDLNHPFTNKLIHGLYPPGSIVKPGIGMAFLDSPKITSWYLFSCNGSIEIGSRAKHKFRCWKKRGHGETDFVKAIRESCDVYFYKGSLLVGIDAIAQMLRRMGLGQKTGVDLPNEFIGVVPDKQWKRDKYGQPWYIGETLNASIGQGYMLVTPMQIARYMAFLATGRLPTPHFAASIGSKQVVYQPQEVFRISHQKAFAVVRKAMYEVCNHPKGTAQPFLRHCKVTVAGKTGTAQVIGIPQEEKRRMREEELAYFHRSHAWLTTYGPFDRPQYVVTILVEHGGHGGHAAGPMAKKIYNWLLAHGYITRQGASMKGMLEKNRQSNPKHDAGGFDIEAVGSDKKEHKGHAHHEKNIKRGH